MGPMRAVYPAAVAYRGPALTPRPPEATPSSQNDPPPSATR
jgi:hypothetical protein